MSFLKPRKLDSGSTFLLWLLRALDKFRGRSIDTHVNLVKLAVVFWIHIAFNPWSKPSCLLYGSYYALQLIKPIVWFDS